MRNEHAAASRLDRTRSGAALRLCLLAAVSVACPLLLTACRSNKKYDLLEAELRTRERELAETRAALDQARVINRLTEQSRPRELPGSPVSDRGPGGVGCPIRQIALGRGTGGVDDDGFPGDEALMVVIVPTDEDRSAVKVPARASIAAWEITPQGLKNPIGAWEISMEQLRPTWRSGLLATGYFVPLSWQTAPSSERVRVAVRLTTADGQVYEADRDISVRPVVRSGPTPAAPYPAPAAPYPAPPAPPKGPREPLLPGVPPPGVPSVVPPGVEELPPPAGVPPERGARLLPPLKE